MWIVFWVVVWGVAIVVFGTWGIIVVFPIHAMLQWIRDETRRERDRVARMAEQDHNREWHRIQQMYRDAWNKARDLPEEERRRQEFTRLEEARSKWLKAEELAADDRRRP